METDRSTTASGGSPPTADQPPPELPIDSAAFFRAGSDVELLEVSIPPDAKPALERLGPAPFRRGGFPLLGFLASVYEHVAQHTGGVEAKGEK